MHASDAKVIASSLAFAAFAVAIVAGLAAEVPTATILTRAIVAMVAANLLGWPIGVIVSRIVTDHAVKYASVNPLGEKSSPVFAATVAEQNSGQSVDEKNIRV